MRKIFMKKTKKCLPHIIAVVSLVLFIGLGLASDATMPPVVDPPIVGAWVDPANPDNSITFNRDGSGVVTGSDGTAVIDMPITWSTSGNQLTISMSGFDVTVTSTFSITGNTLTNVGADGASATYTRRGTQGGGTTVVTPREPPVSPPTVVRREFTTAGTHSYVFSDGFPATVEIYAVGAGGGGQGGHTKDYQQGLGTRTEFGAGASGGGGGLIYSRIQITSATTFNIVVGAGGAGGARHHRGVGGSWESGRAGSAGGNTTVSSPAGIITAFGGGGGGGSGSQNVTGGIGGRPSVHAPQGVLQWEVRAGTNGINGRHNVSERVQNAGGAGGSINIGSAGSNFTGGLGGNGGFRIEGGATGAPGRVLIIVTHPSR
jgi:hypothetical protein